MAEPRDALNVISALSLLLVTVCIVASRLADMPSASLLAQAALVLFCLAQSARIGPGAKMMVAAAFASAALVAFVATPLHILGAALERAAFFAALLTSLAILREAARASPVLLKAGASLVEQPPGLRYALISIGSHLASIVLNFGVMPLLGSAIRRTGEANGEGAGHIGNLQKRMSLGLLRGFATMPMWSPLSLSFAVTAASIASIQTHRLILCGLMTASIFMVFGFLWDRATETGSRVAGAAIPQGGHIRPLLEMALLVAAVISAVVLIAWLLSASSIDAVIVGCPVIGLVWLSCQVKTPGIRARLFQPVRLLVAQLQHTLPGQRDEIFILGGASFVGTVLAALIPVSALQTADASLSIPPAVLAVLIGWTVVIAGQFGLGPVLMVTVLGSAFHDPAAYGIDPVLLGVALMGGWGLAVGSTPVAAGILTLARIWNVRAGEIGRQWNGGYTIAASVVLAVWLLLLNAVLKP